MQSVSSRIWTRITASNSYDDNHYTTGTSIKAKETQFLPGSGRIDTAIWMHYLDANKTAGEKLDGNYTKNAASNIEQVLEVTPYKATTIQPPASHHENYER